MIRLARLVRLSVLKGKRRKEKQKRAEAERWHSSWFSALVLVPFYNLASYCRAAWINRTRHNAWRALLGAEELEPRVVPTLLGQQLFPSDYAWNQNIHDAPVAANSAAIISHIDPAITVHPDWGWDDPNNVGGALYGIPVNVVHGNSVAKINVIIDNYPGESDILPCPIPANAVIEGDYQSGPNPNGPGYNNGQRGDSHMIVWDEDNNIAYEFYLATRPSDPVLPSGAPHTDGLWHAGQESVWNTAADSFRPLGWTSADAAGLSILAGLARPDEGLPVSQGGQGVINHALRFTLPSGDVTSQYVYPASHMVSVGSGSTSVPLGTRFRLKDTPTIDALISTMGPQAQNVAKAMQQYGLILADIGAPMYVQGASGAVDANNNLTLVWNIDDVLGGMEQLNVGDFDVLDLTPTVTAISPSSAPTGSTVTIVGQNFSGAAGHLSVFFGSTPATSVTYVDDAHIQAVVPAGTGTVNVTVQSGVNEIDPNNPSDNVNNPIFGYGVSAVSGADQFTFGSISATTHFAVSAPSNVTAGKPMMFMVTALDPSNTTVSGYNGTVHFASSDPQVALSSTTATLTNGSGRFAAMLRTAGSQSISVNDVSVTSITGLSNSVAVVAANASHFTLNTSSAVSYPGMASVYLSGQNAHPATSFMNTGSALTLSLVAVDPFGNIDLNYHGTVVFGSTDGKAILPPLSTLTSGVGTFSASLETAGSQLISATDSAAASVTGVTSAIVARGLVVTGFTTTPTGFVVNFNRPFNSSTVSVYTQIGVADDILIATFGTQVSVHGTVLFNSSTNPTQLTFVKTAMVSATGTFNPTSGLLSAGNYTVTLRSSSAGNGFADMLGASLDGNDSGTPGQNYVFTFSVTAPPVAVGIPDFARGPSNTDTIFLPSTIGNGGTFNLIYTNPGVSPATGTARVTFSTTAATLLSNLQNALNSLPQIGMVNGVPDAVASIISDSNSGANIQLTFQNSLVSATNQLLASNTAGVSISLASINVSNGIAGNGIPVALSSGLNVTSGSFTLQYNPALLNISGAVSKIGGATFAVNTTINSATSATAVITFSSPTKISSTATAITLGSLLATVPMPATASYGARQLLHFSSEQLRGTAGSITVTNQDAVQVAAFFGDVVGSAASFGLVDATAISAVAGLTPSATQQTIPGFNAYPNLDPVIIGDVALQGLGGIVSTDASKMNQELTMAQASIPYLPAGLTASPVTATIVATQSTSQSIQVNGSAISPSYDTIVARSRPLRRPLFLLEGQSTDDSAWPW
jgi:hypothetical protein